MSNFSKPSTPEQQTKPNRFAHDVAKMFAGHVHFEPAIAVPAPDKIILLCFTNRSGSNFLASALGSTLPIQNFGECLLREGLARQRSTMPEASFHAVFADRMTTRGSKRIACVKVGQWQLLALHDWGFLEGYRSRLHYIYIRRNDILGQAISLEIAATTKAWTSSQKARAEEVVYERFSIQKKVRGLERGNRNFEAFFAEQGIAPSRVVYEEFVADPAGHVARIGREIGEVGLVFKPELVRTQKQVDPCKDAFRTRFLAETGRSHATTTQEPLP